MPRGSLTRGTCAQHQEDFCSRPHVILAAGQAQGHRPRQRMLDRSVHAGTEGLEALLLAGLLHALQEHPCMAVQCSKAHAAYGVGVVPRVVSFLTLRREALLAGRRACTSNPARPPPRRSPWSDTGCPPRHPSCASAHLASFLLAKHLVSFLLTKPRRCIRPCLMALHRS